MKLRLATARVLAAEVVLALLALLIARDGLSSHLTAAGRPAGALAVDPASPAANALGAELAVRQNHFPEGARLAERALAGAPMTAAAMRVLAVVRYKLGDAGGGARALGLAGTLGWRDSPTQVLLLLDALNRHDGAAAVQHADALGRRKSALAMAFAGLRAIALEPGGAKLVADRLSQSPNYRAAFLNDVSKLRPLEYDAREAVYADLARGVAPPAAADVNPYVGMLEARGQYDRARRVWTQWAGEGGNASLALQDGGFDHIASGYNGFGWQIMNGAAAAVSRSSDTDGDRSNLLHVQGDGSRSLPLVRQMVTLSPDRHVFAVDGAFSAIAARDAFRWSVRCRGSGRELPLAVRSADLSGKWRRIEAEFDVPANDCATQVVQLDARAVDQRQTLSASFDRAEIR